MEMKTNAPDMDRGLLPGQIHASRDPALPGGGEKISSNRQIAIVQADYLALANDLEQAQALASALEMELSGKSNELARFKLVWERTQADLAKFARDIEAMRQERHTLANEAQRAQAFEFKVQKVQKAHDALAARVEELEAELTREREAHRQTRAHVSADPKDDLRLRQTLQKLREQIDQALAQTAVQAPAEPTKTEHIEIEFST